MAIDYDVQGALAAGITLPQIADYLGQRAQFDVASARKAGHSDVDIIGSLAGSDAIEGLQGGTGDLSRGAQTALGQTVPTLKGVAGLIGATAEKAFGEGGVSTALKNWGLNGYKAGMEKIQPLSRDTDELTTALDKAKQGNLGALVDWATWAVGYGLGQIGESAAMAVVGGVAGAAMAPEAAPVTGAAGAVTGLVAKGAVKDLAQGMIEKAVVKEANRLMAQSGGKLAAEAATKQATKAVAASIGKGGALMGWETGMELGSIYADAEAQARKEGRQLDGADLARVWGTGILAGGVGAVGDKIGLDAVTGKLSSALPGGRLARTAGGAMVAGTSNSAEESVQTMLERFGAGKEVFSPEGVNDIINAAGAGFMGSAPAGAFGGIISRQRQDVAVEKGKATLDRDLSVGGAQKAIDAAAAELRGATDAYLGGVPPVAPPAAPAAAPVDLGTGGLLPKQLAAMQAAGLSTQGIPTRQTAVQPDQAQTAAPVVNAPPKPSGRPWSPEAAEFIAESATGQPQGATGQPGGATPEQLRMANLRTMVDRDSELTQKVSGGPSEAVPNRMRADAVAVLKESVRSDDAAELIENDPKSNAAALQHAAQLRRHAQDLRTLSSNLEAKAETMAAKHAAMQPAGTQFERDQAAAQRAVNLEKRAPAKVGEASNLVDLTPMTSKEAMNRLNVLRDMIANEGGNALGLAIVPHPSQKGKFAIGQRELPSLKLDPIEQPVNEAETQARLETAALTGKEQARRDEDKQRQDMISRARANIEARGGVASPYEAQLLLEANQGQPYDSIDPSLGRPASPDQVLTARTGILVGSEAGLGYSAPESKTPRQEEAPRSDLKVNVRQRALPSDADTVVQARLEHAAAQGRLAAAQTDELQRALGRPAGENPVEALRNVQGNATTPDDIKQLVDAANQRRDAAETAEIERMLVDDEAQAKASANAVALASQDETATAKARQIAVKARENLVTHLLERFAEPNGYFASAAIKAINKQLSVLQREPLSKGERARIDALLGRTRAFFEPNLPADKPLVIDRGADNSSMERLIKPQPTAESIAQKEDELQVQRALKGYEAGQRPADPLAGIKGETTTQADVQQLVAAVRSEKDAAETAEIERMLAEDAKVEKAKADAVRQASDNETAQAKAQELADVARRKLVDHLVERFAEPNGYFASGVIQAVNKQLSVLGREPLSKGERAGIDDLLGRTRAFLQPNLPSAPERVEDRGADNAAMENLIPERGDKGPAGTPKPKVPRPSKVGGVPTAQLTDEQLSATASNDQLPAITRRGATVELQAREEERQAKDVDLDETRTGMEVDAADAEALREALRTDTDPATGKPIQSQGRRNELATELENLEGSVATAEEALAKAPATKRRKGEVLPEPVSIDVESFEQEFPEFQGYGITQITLKNNDIDFKSKHTIDGYATLNKYSQRDFVNAYLDGKLLPAEQERKLPALQPGARATPSQQKAWLLERIDEAMADALPADETISSSQARTTNGKREFSVYKGEGPDRIVVTVTEGANTWRMDDPRLPSHKRVLSPLHFFTATDLGDARKQAERAMQWIERDGKNLVKRDAPKVTFSVPNSGIRYTVVNTVPSLQSLRKKIETSPGFQDTMRRPAAEQNPGVQRGSATAKAAIENMIDEGDAQAAVDYAAHKGLDLAQTLKNDPARLKQVESLTPTADEEETPAPKAEDKPYKNLDLSFRLTWPQVIAAYQKAATVIRGKTWTSNLQTRLNDRLKSALKEAGLQDFEADWLVFHANTVHNRNSTNSGAMMFLSAKELAEAAVDIAMVADPKDQAKLSTQRTGTVQDGETQHSYTVVDGLTNQSGLTKVLREIARVFGKQVVFFQSDTLKADGFVNPGNSRDIHINADSKMSPVAVLGHELMHLFKMDNPVAYRAIAAVLARQVDEKGRALFRADYGQGANLEELSADLLGNAFQDPGFLASVFAEIGSTAPEGEARNIVQRLVSALNDAIAAALKVIQEMGVQPGFKADMIVKDLQAVRSALRLAMVEYGKGQREQAQGAVQNESADGGMMASRQRQADAGADADADAKYMDAVQRGDMETAQRLIDQAARNAGYLSNTDYRMAHQAPNSLDGTSLVNIRTEGLVPADYWTKPEWYQTTPEEMESWRKISDVFRRLDAKSQPGKPYPVAMTVYRSVPKDVKDGSIRNGDWVTPSLAYAKLEGASIPGGYRVIAQQVLAKNLYWDGNSIAEMGYDDGQGYAYKNTKNNRKLLNAVTRDDEGNVIPPSKRFNARSDDARFSRQRAEAAGFDTSKVWYHGTATRSNFKSFKAGKNGFDELGKGIYFTGDPDTAGAWAGPDGGRLIPVYLKKGDLFDLSKRIDYSALAERVKANNPVDDALRQAREIRSTKDVLEWTEEDNRVINAADEQGLWRSWLLEPTADLAAFIRRSDLNTWLNRAGYIGAVNHNSQIHDQVVVFDAKNVRSVWAKFNPAKSDSPDILASRQRIFGDSGRTYTPEQLQMFQNVGRSVEEPTIKERIASLRKDLGKKLIQGVVDQFAPLKEVSTKAYQLARLSKGASGAMDAMLHHGKLSIRDGVYDADMSGGVLERLGVPLHGEFDDFLSWVAGNRAERLAAEDRENLFTPADIQAAKSLANGTTSFDYTLQHGANAGQVTRDRSLIYADALKTFNEFHKNALDMAEQSGLIDRDARQIWENEFYVPFHRVSEEGFIGDTIKGGLVRQQAIKTLKGGTDKLDDLMANTLLNWAHLVDAAAKNRAALASLEAAQQMGVAVEASEDIARQMAKSMGVKSQVVWAMEDGKKRFFVVEDKAMLQAITSLQYAGLKGPIMDALSTFKHVLTVGVTASPAFKIRNLARDSVQAIASAPLSYNLFKNLAEGYKASDPNSQTYVSALASGGLIRFGTMIEGNEAARTRQLIKMGIKDSTILNSQSKLDALWTKMEKGFMAYQELGNRGEEINRAALYKQLIDQGVSHGEAALQARDLMDFSLQGTFTTVRFLSQVVPFLNARLQGLYKLGRAGKEDPRRFAAVFGAVALASVSLMLAYQDDDDWKKREDWDRNNYWWFKVGGLAYRIPKPFEIGAMATLAERGLEYFINPEMTGKRMYENVRDIVMDQLSMNPIPQAVKPILDIYSNKDSFSGRPIESMGMDRLRPDYRYTGNTSMLARGVSTAGQAVASQVNGQFLSPVQIDHLLHGYFSWLGSFVVGATDMALRPLTGQAERPAADYWKVATQGIVQEANSPQSRYVSQMYQQAKEVEQVYSTWNMLRKQGRLEEASQFLEANADSIQRYKRVEGVKERETKINERIRMIERSSMSAADKKAQITGLQGLRDQTARLLTQ